MPAAAAKNAVLLVLSISMQRYRSLPLRLNENFISMPPPTVQPSGVGARNGREDRNPAVVNGARVHVRLEPTVGKAAGCVQQGAGADKYAAAAAERTKSFQRLVDDRRSTLLLFQRLHISHTGYNTCGDKEPQQTHCTAE